jgi:type I restriction enzyme S subunit
MRLQEICELIVDCEHKTAPTQDTGYPSIRTPNIGRGYFVLDGVNRVSEETYRLWTRRARPRSGDLIMAREAPVGNVAIIPEGLEPCLGQRTLLIRPDPSKVDPLYLNYFLNGPYVQGLIQGKTNGATVAHLNMEDVRTMHLPAPPPLSIQRRASKILGAYDDLIENNNRRIKILEEIAKMIYREWFVNLILRGHEKVNTVQSEMGYTPDGWRRCRVSEAVEIDPTTKVPREGLKPFVPMGSLSSNSMLITEIENREGNGGSKFRNGDTLFARITPCLENGKTGFVQFLPTPYAVAFGSTEFIVLRSKTLCPEYVYLMARSDAFRDNAIKSMSGATGRQRVQQGCFDKFIVAQPPPDVLHSFQNVVAPMFRLIYALSRKNKNLRMIRDLLIPKLVSGEITPEQIQTQTVTHTV